MSWGHIKNRFRLHCVWEREALSAITSRWTGSSKKYSVQRITRYSHFHGCLLQQGFQTRGTDDHLRGYHKVSHTFPKSSVYVKIRSSSKMIDRLTSSSSLANDWEHRRTVFSLFSLLHASFHLHYFLAHWFEKGVKGDSQNMIGVPGVRKVGNACFRVWNNPLLTLYLLPFFHRSFKIVTAYNFVQKQMFYS